MRRVGSRRAGAMTELRRDLPVLLLHNMNSEWTPEERSETQEDVTAFAETLREVGHPLEVVTLEDSHLAERLKGFDPGGHIVFNWCEQLPGISHSEPDVAAVLEQLGFVFTGSSCEVLSLSYDKPRVKRLLDEARLPTPPWAVFHTPAAGGWDIFPAIVKAANEHCSIGISTESVVTSPAELERRIAFILEIHRQPALVEEFIDGRELHQGAWGDGRVSSLPATEMDYSKLSDIHERLFTYEAKYDHKSRLYDKIALHVPALLEPAEKRELERIVLATYQASGCRDYGRIDVRLRDGVFHVIDVNPNPDINPLTSLTQAAADAGYSYGEMGSRIVNLAAARHPRFRA